MTAVELFAQKAGTTADDFIRDVFKRVMDSMEGAQAACDPLHGSFATAIPSRRASDIPDNVVPFPAKGR